MWLYLMRHGAAEDRAATGRDADRALTPTGSAVVRRVAQALVDAGVPLPAQIIASPLLRAQQTAEIMRAVLALQVDIDTDEDLAPDTFAHDLATRLWSATHPILLVGHLPNIEMVARSLAAPHRAGPQSASHGFPERLPSGFRTATVVAFHLEGRPPPYRVALALDPTTLPEI
ncbi:MAG: phosphohistidine phosphatase SixA [Polyangiaceae bacterium]|nr:phosphohistidine phosphatase SixA [Polyangiaceae bacterium]